MGVGSGGVGGGGVGSVPRGILIFSYVNTRIFETDPKARGKAVYRLTNFNCVLFFFFICDALVYNL